MATPKDMLPVHDSGTALQEKSAVKRPKRYKVLLYNDDYTPMEFVISILEELFDKSPAEATQIMLHVHRNGIGIAGVYILEVAETKVAQVHQQADSYGFPLRAGAEAE